MKKMNIINYSIYVIGGGQLTYNNYILTKNKTIDKISRNR